MLKIDSLEDMRPCFGSQNDDFTFNLDPVRVPQKYQGKTYHKGKKKGQLSGNPKGMNPSDFWFYELMQNEYAEGVWDFPNVKANHPEKTEHPCSFPIELCRKMYFSIYK